MRFAHAQGLPDRQIVFGHVLRTSSIPIVTVLGLELGSTPAFAVVTETVFAWPGLGKLIIDPIPELDRPVMVSCLVVSVILFVVVDLVVDPVHAGLGPLVRLGGGARCPPARPRPPRTPSPCPSGRAQPWRRARRLLDFWPDYARSSVAVAALP